MHTFGPLRAGGGEGGAKAIFGLKKSPAPVMHRSAKPTIPSGPPSHGDHESGVKILVGHRTAEITASQYLKLI